MTFSDLERNMPGRMDDNLRRGNATEDLGLLLLRGFAAVAPVPRTQDVGIDAIATLLQRVDRRRLIARDSIFVQLKSASVTAIEYDDAELDWLAQLELPFFVGSVDSATSEMSLYTIHHLTALLDPDHPFAGVVLTLQPEKDSLKRPADPQASFEEWLPEHPDPFVPKFYLGPPVLRWSVTDSASPGFLDSAFDVMAEWSKVEHANMRLRKMGRSVVCDWETGKPPVRQASFSAASPRDKACLQNAVELLKTALGRVAAELLIKGDTELLIDVSRIAERLQPYGFDSGELLGIAVAGKMRQDRHGWSGDGT